MTNLEYNYDDLDGYDYAEAVEELASRAYYSRLAMEEAYEEPVS